MIEIEYIVKDSKGAEQLRTTDKKAAEAYDKALDNAEHLQELLRHDKILPNLSESDLEELTIYLALNAKNVDRILKGKAPELSGSEDSSEDKSPKSANVAPIKTAKE